jgi:hypothetical protein
LTFDRFLHRHIIIVMAEGKLAKSVILPPQLFKWTMAN